MPAQDGLPATECEAWSPDAGRVSSAGNDLVVSFVDKVHDKVYDKEGDHLRQANLPTSGTGTAGSAS